MIPAILAAMALFSVSARSSEVKAPKTLSAQEMVAASDRVRNPGKPFRVRNQLTEYLNGSARDITALMVYSKEDDTSGQFRNVMRYLNPPRDAGKAVLLNGTKMWFYDPSSKASVRISPQQRLLGQASEGDVMTVNLARDYAAKLVGAEKLLDADHHPRSCWHLDLTPSKDDAIYGRIEYWVEQGTFRPIKGKFYSDSGRVLKIAYYHRYENELGGSRPTETIIIDAVNPRDVTTMQLSDYGYVSIPEAWFQREFLPRLKSDSGS